MRNSKRNITKRRQTKSNKKASKKRTSKRTSKKYSKCIYTDEAKRIMRMIKLIKNRTNKKR
jgi:hypothetical protein